MSRLQTKCVFASAAAHGLLLGLLVVGSAFVKPPKKEDNVRFVKIFRDSQITDGETQGGGNPNVPSDATPPAPQKQQTVQQDPPPPVKQADPPPPEVKKQPETKPPEKKPTPPKPDPKPPETKITKNLNSTKVVPKNKLTEKPPEVKPDKPKIEVNTDLVKTAKADPDAERQKRERERAAKAERDRQEREYQAAIRAQMEAVDRANRQRQENLAAFGNIVGKLENKMSTGVAVEMPGPGGEAFINYADLIWTKYYQAWQTPEARDVRNPVKVEIVVAKDGRVISANIIKPSGDAQLDKSVRQALDRVTRLPAFPEGAKDPQRSFRINFELKSKRQFG
jgi:TonB family protein